jgi:hypothetical protein
MMPEDECGELPDADLGDSFGDPDAWEDYSDSDDDGDDTDTDE